VYRIQPTLSEKVAVSNTSNGVEEEHCCIEYKQCCRGFGRGPLYRIRAARMVVGEEKHLFLFKFFRSFIDKVTWAQARDLLERDENKLAQLEGEC